MCGWGRAASAPPFDLGASRELAVTPRTVQGTAPGVAPKHYFIQAQDWQHVRVTTIAAWAGVDTHGVSSVYIASDSRITWGAQTRWDQGRKTFASEKFPYIFGYWGDVLFPAMVIPQVVESIDRGLIRLNPNRSFGAVGSAIRRLWLGYPPGQRRDCGILMAHRLGSGMKSNFTFASFTYEAKTDLWKRRSIAMPTQSAELRIAGSGARSVQSTKKLWDASRHGGTSRAVFSAICESILSGSDPLSGGGPQLVGLRRIGNGHTFGVAVEGQRYFAGTRVRRDDVSEEVEWFNDLFERVDGTTMRRLPDAQRHTRRPST